MEIQELKYKNEEKSYNIKFNFGCEEYEMEIGLSELLDELDKYEE